MKKYSIDIYLSGDINCSHDHHAIYDYLSEACEQSVNYLKFAINSNGIEASVKSKVSVTEKTEEN